MSRLGILTAVAFFATIGSAYADGQVWTVQNWPGDIDLIPCSAWTKNADGGWALTGGSVKLGAATMATSASRATPRRISSTGNAGALRRNRGKGEAELGSAAFG